MREVGTVAEMTATHATGPSRSRIVATCVALILAAWPLTSCTSAGPGRGDSGAVPPDVVGTWSPVLVDGQDVSSDPDVGLWGLEFRSDGTWRRTQCGSIGGEYTLSGTSFRSGAGADIGVGCSGPYIDYLTTLGKVRVAKVEGSTLFLESTSGKALLVMIRTAGAAGA